MAATLKGRRPDGAFWRGKRVVLTGHTGFKGAWLALWLRRLGAEVTGLALAPERPSLAEAACVERRISWRRLDIRDAAAVRDAVADADPDIVFHLAAQSLVRRSYREPVETIATNVLGTAHVLEAARHAPRVAAFVSVTTDKCYENREWVWAYRESDRLGGHDPYSASKACAELVTAAWRRSFLSQDRPGKPVLAVASARAGNVIGGGDFAADRIIPDCIRAFAAGQAAWIRNPRATRPWQHVLEPLCGYLLLAERLCRSGRDFAQAWNFGPPAEDVQPVAAVADGLAQAWGDGACWEAERGQAERGHAEIGREDGGAHPHEAGSLAVDASLARARLDWRPALRLDTALEWTGQWYRRHRDGRDAESLVDADITRYEHLGESP